MHICAILKKDMITIVKNKFEAVGDAVLSAIAVDLPKSKNFGDLSTNAALLVASELKINTLQVAEKLRNAIMELEYIDHVDIAGRGFLNLTLVRSEWLEILHNIITSGITYGYNSSGGGDIAVNIEYVSANPTGPMHIGHARGAILGDTIANLLQCNGFRVTREYYINDAGSQINHLVYSVYLRYVEIVTGVEPVFGPDMYRGAYLIPVAEKLYTLYDTGLIDKLDVHYSAVKKFVVEEMMNYIKQDLALLSVSHDIFFSESSLHESKISAIIDDLKEHGLVYSGNLERPRHEDSNWTSETHLLFKSTEFGDDQDRVITKSNGEYTYFAPEIAYIKDKIERGYQKLIMILGADHIGYIQRVQAIYNAILKIKGQNLTLNNNIIDNNNNLFVQIYQLVNYIKNDQQVKMSKRSGNVTTVPDVLAEVEVDAIRFMMLSAKSNVVIDFDLEKTKQQTKDNPIFYIRYAYARINSVLRLCAQDLPEAYDKVLGIRDIASSTDNNRSTNISYLNYLDNEEEYVLIKKMAMWPKIIENAILYLEPHRISLYLYELASEFHSMWSFNKSGTPYRIIVRDDIQITVARLSLCIAVQNVIAAGMNILNVKLNDSM